MTPTLWGAVVGTGVGVGLLLVVDRVLAARRTPFEVRVLPYLRDLPQQSAARPTLAPTSALQGVFGPLLQQAADVVERLLGGSASIRRRLERADLDLTVRDFRVQQVLWGLVGFAVVAVPAVLVSLASPQRAVPLLAVCLVAFALGVLLRENRLTAQVTTRERLVMEEFPTVAELLALSVAAGESPVAALDRVCRRSHGELAADLRRVLADVRTGTPVTHAFDALASRTGLPVVARFAEGLAIAVERGTPLSDVLHAQAADVREAGRRALIESGGRREIAMMVPVVFLVLPITILFAFWPGLVGLHLVTT
ncbi:pilus assembly protein TadB [Nocardioides mangrovicus]|uniref:Pilus assembly protein TadB n=1 Tax=Nocardioides mangrovicus TaxID=2478913 RepID=A0A3L8P603_9ACTN|nr:type II secretion system F family protein [Nocardioides mangrovicus]RLV49848.1 pilus assembly protein TadB [Nocardioides mangrovicus]